MDFCLLLVVTAILRIRPTDLTPGYESFPLYYIAIVSCILFSLDKLALEVSAIFEGKRPLGAFMMGILVLIPLSDAMQGNIEIGFNAAVEYLKVFLFYVLLVGIVNTPARLRTLLVALVIIDMVPSTLALLHQWKYIYVPAYDDPRSSLVFEWDPESEKEVMVRRLIASGMFNDPNDFCQIMNTGLMFCLGGLLNRAAGFGRVLWLAPMVIFGFAIKETGSRGGLLGTLGGVTVLIWTRYGTRRTVISLAALGVLGLPLLSGRMAQLFTTEEGTSQARLQIWSNSFFAFLHSPIILGIGADRHGDVVGRATHNGFLCAFTELGLVGGVLFFGCFYWALTSLWRVGSNGRVIRDPTVRRLRPYVLAALVGYTINEMSLTHPYTVVTYMMLGLATATIRLADPDATMEDSRLHARLFRRVFAGGMIFIVLLYVFVRIKARG